MRFIGCIMNKFIDNKSKDGIIRYIDKSNKAPLVILYPIRVILNNKTYNDISIDNIDGYILININWSNDNNITGIFKHYPLYFNNDNIYIDVIIYRETQSDNKSIHKVIVKLFRK